MGKIKSIIYTVIGTALTGFAVSTLLTPNKIVCGGVSGISTILYQTLKFAPGLTYAIINIKSVYHLQKTDFFERII